jgi:hypothetical protein
MEGKKKVQLSTTAEIKASFYIPIHLNSTQKKETDLKRPHTNGA